MKHDESALTHERPVAEEVLADSFVRVIAVDEQNVQLASGEHGPGTFHGGGRIGRSVDIVQVVPGRGKVPKAALASDEQVDAEHELDRRQGVHEEAVRASICGADLADVARRFARKSSQEREYLRPE